MTTVAEALHVAEDRLSAAGVADARLEAEVLLAFALETDRAHLLARLPDDLHAEVTGRIAALLERRAVAHEPLAYLVGVREFYGLELICAPGALISRPETELLVDLALAEVNARADRLRIIDVGTGSGAIAVAIAVSAPSVHVLAIDSSERALQIARANAERHAVVDRIVFCNGNLLEDTDEFDVIIANLPYVSEAEWDQLPPEIRQFEPREALVGGPRGSETVARLLATAVSHLASGGLLAAEIGATQGEESLRIARSHFPAAQCSVKKDLAGLDRVLTVRQGRMVERIDTATGG